VRRLRHHCVKWNNEEHDLLKRPPRDRDGQWRTSVELHRIWHVGSPAVWSLSRHLDRPPNHWPGSALVQATELLGDGALDYRIEVADRDELGALASALNGMAGQTPGGAEGFASSNLGAVFGIEAVSEKVWRSLSRMVLFWYSTRRSADHRNERHPNHER